MPPVWRVSDATLNRSTPQFGTAEYVGSPGDDHCHFCQQPITAAYYRVNAAMACVGCAESSSPQTQVGYNQEGGVRITNLPHGLSRSPIRNLPP